MSRLAGVALTLVLVLGQALLGTPPAASHTAPHVSPRASHATSPGVSPAAGREPAGRHVREADTGSGAVRLDLDRMTPRRAGPDDSTVTLAATVTNTGDRPISDLVARIQAGPRQTGAGTLGRTLADPPPAGAGWSDWVGVADRLEIGDTAELSITTDLAALGITDPGVYPLLLNVNGTPAYGGPARLAVANLLLPVLGGPGPGASDGAAGRPVSLLWPLAAREPKVVSAPYGGPVVLADDALAAALAPGGRLDTLVRAAESRRDAPEVFGSLCFAVDPDLLETVHAMSGGYRVRTTQGDVAGKGAEHARRWLADLRELVAGHCVVQLPYASAELAALSRVESRTDLAADAVRNSATVLDLLHLEPKRNVVWTRSEVDGSVLDAMAAAGTDTVLADPARIAADTVSDEVRVVPTDPLVTTAFTTSGPGTSSAGTSGTGDPGLDVGTQNAAGALAVRAGVGAEGGTSPLLVAPPHGWGATHDDLTSLLDTVERLRTTGALAPTPLGELVTEPGPDTEAVGTTTPAQAPHGRRKPGTAPVSDALLEALDAVETTAADLRGAMSVDPTRQVEPVSVIQPLHNAVLRTLSVGWRTGDARMEAAAAAEAQVRDLRDRVTVQTPSQPVSLASESSPLPVTVSNDLPVAVTVRVDLGDSPGLRPARIGDTPLAADSSVSRLIPADTLRSGRFIVRVAVTTPGGTTLGSPARMELVSSELGTVVVVLTATAGAALLLLSGLRIYRRVSTGAGKRG